MTNPIYKLSNLADVRAGYLTREAVRNDPEGTHRLLQIRDFSRDRATVNVADMVRLTPESRSSVCPLQPGDVVFLAKGANNFAAAISGLPTPT
ncbi:MAG: restriction endonuclease subunit S, partial [Kiritimatiellae bacterium]|nr:restriction endonuclease subunit S [Kiritimatiellia bacterium]